MHKLFLILAFFILTSATVHGQWDTPVPVKYVASLPVTCEPTKKSGVLVYKYTAPVAVYYCSGLNQWTLINTTPASGIVSLNGLASSAQTFAVGTTGTNFNIVSSGADHTFHFPNASASNRGLLIAADWTSFNAKIGTLNGLTGATQTFATGTAGSDFNIASSGSAHTFNFPTASASNRGLLSAANWTAFNAKVGSLNGLTAATQAFAAPTANDTASWSSVTSTHTLRLPITAVSGTSRTNSFPYFDSTNTLAKSPFTWDGTTFAWAEGGTGLEFSFTPGSGGDGSFVVGHLTGAPDPNVGLTINGTTGDATLQADGTLILQGTTSVDGTLSIGGGTALSTSNQTGTGNIVLSASPVLTGTPSLAAATATSINLGGATVTDILTGTASLDYSQAAGNACEVLTITVTGAADGDDVSLGVPNALSADNATSTFFGWVSASNTVSVKRCVIDADGDEPLAATVRATIVKF